MLLKGNIEFLWWWRGGGGGVHIHLHVQPNCRVEVVLCCVVVGVMAFKSVEDLSMTF